MPRFSIYVRHFTLASGTVVFLSLLGVCKLLGLNCSFRVWGFFGIFRHFCIGHFLKIEYLFALFVLHSS